jgi:hypothetical protein
VLWGWTMLPATSCCACWQLTPPHAQQHARHALDTVFLNCEFTSLSMHSTSPRDVLTRACPPHWLQVLRHPWLAEVQGFMPSTRLDASPGAQAPATTPSPVHAGSQGFEANLTRTASEMARLGFQPTADREEQAQR